MKTATGQCQLKWKQTFNEYVCYHR